MTTLVGTDDEQLWELRDAAGIARPANSQLIPQKKSLTLFFRNAEERSDFCRELKTRRYTIGQTLTPRYDDPNSGGFFGLVHEDWVTQQNLYPLTVPRNMLEEAVLKQAPEWTVQEVDAMGQDMTPKTKQALGLS